MHGTDDSGSEHERSKQGKSLLDFPSQNTVRGCQWTLSAFQSVIHLVHDRWDESWADGRDMDGEELLAELAAEHRANGSQFNDDRFPANDSSLFMRGSADTGSRPSAAGVLRHDQKPFLQSRSHEVEWKSPSEILDVNAKPVIFSGGIEPDDIHQGELGNCSQSCMQWRGARLEINI